MKKFKLSITSILALVVIALVFLYVPAQAEQPGTVLDPLVTRNYVDSRIAELQNEIAVLRNIVAGVSPTDILNLPTQQAGQAVITQADRDALMAEMIAHFEATYASIILQQALHGPGFVTQVVPFQVIHAQAGQIITFEAGTEFILRGGTAVALTGPLNGIPNVTAGTDVMNGEAIGLNHLMMIPFTDGRGMVLQSEAWVMVRGGYILH
jgi:hypothetical protein